MMRAILVALLLIGGLMPVRAEGVVNRAVITGAGLFKLGTMKTISDPSISTGQRTQAAGVENDQHSVSDGPTLVRRTTTITAGPDVVFGINVRLIGEPAGATAPIRVVWRYPQPGLRNPNGTVKFTDEYEETRGVDEKTTYYWALGPEWTLVPGEWTIELWSGGKMLVKQAFQLQR